MANLNDYLYWRGDLSFIAVPLNEIDNLILSEVIYMSFKDAFKSNHQIKLKTAINNIFENKMPKDIVLGAIVPHEIVDMTYDLKNHSRFSEISVSDYKDIVTLDPACQFAAITYHLTDYIIYVAFRGTDDTLIGWQENIDLIFKNPTPAEKCAQEYLDEIANKYPNCKIYVGGHSKGGNLATYAGIYCNDEVKDRIIRVYSNDGPGFLKGFIAADKFDLIKAKITLITPYNSIVGSLLEPKYGKLIVCDSKSRGVYQHNAFNWLINANCFVKKDRISDNANKLAIAIRKIVYKLSDKEKEELAISLYNFVIELKKDTLIDAKKDVFRLIKYVNRIPLQYRKVFRMLLQYFVIYNQL